MWTGSWGIVWFVEDDGGHLRKRLNILITVSLFTRNADLFISLNLWSTSNRFYLDLNESPEMLKEISVVNESQLCDVPFGHVHSIINLHRIYLRGLKYFNVIPDPEREFSLRSK